MDNKESPDKPAKGYGKHSKSFWIIIYIIGAIIVYGLIYLLFIHKGGFSSGGGLNY